MAQVETWKVDVAIIYHSR